MACFSVPAAEAVITTVVTKSIEKKGADGKTDVAHHIIGSMKNLNRMLAGGSVLLAFEHFWHGEIQPFFPFLTAASNSADLSEALHEMSTVGVSMALIVTGVWAAMTYVTYKISQKESDEVTA